MFNSVNYIVSAKHYGGSGRQYIREQQRKILQRGLPVTIKDFDKTPTGVPVVARIWQGQWIADCECGGASFVDPDEPVFFCFSCGNRAHGQTLRPVQFPPEDERKEIERLLLLRPVNDLAGLTDLERAGMAKPLIKVQREIMEDLDLQTVQTAMEQGIDLQPRKHVILFDLVRSWEPGQTLADLHTEQDESIEKFYRELQDGSA